MSPSGFSLRPGVCLGLRFTATTVKYLMSIFVRRPYLCRDDVVSHV